ncbi:TIR domain-containing protein, partial [Hymenobacter ruricola]
MAPSSPEYEYDIFISYRHNDNQFDGWVSEFVQHLKDELRATVKGELRIYFDQNPADGLGETHQVNASLDHRLRALILIPLLSLTYCDTARYSWQHEFMPFLQLAQTDPLGLHLRLASGNVGSRVLPLRIHNLDSEDVRLLEQTMGGPLRSIDFVYQELGVNRPLRPKDDELPRPAGGLLYRNQINKVANAIKDLVAAARQPAAPPLPAYAPPAAAPVLAGAAAAVEAAPVVTSATGPVVFLAWTSKELAGRREELALVCAKAGLRVVPNFDCPLDEDEYRARTGEALAQADCA